MADVAATDGGAVKADDRRLHVSREWIAVGATLALWAVPVIVGLRAQALLGETTSRVAAAELFGVQSAKYFGYCPLPLIPPRGNLGDRAEVFGGNFRRTRERSTRGWAAEAVHADYARPAQPPHKVLTPA